MMTVQGTSGLRSYRKRDFDRNGEIRLMSYEQTKSDFLKVVSKIKNSIVLNSRVNVWKYY